MTFAFKMKHGHLGNDLLFVAVFTVWCMLVKSEPSCNQTQFLHVNGTCVACPVCRPGEQLSEDCGFGDGGGGVCIPCEKGEFSADTGVAPCRRCIRCKLLNRQEEAQCCLTSDAQCGPCLLGYYELRSMTGEAELLCVPCFSQNTDHKECLLLKAGGANEESAVTSPEGELNGKKEKATASCVFLVALLLWAFLLLAERSKKLPENCPSPGALLSADDLQYKPVPAPERSSAQQASFQTLVPTQDPLRGLKSLRNESSEVLPTSIMIHVTTNIQPSGEKEEKVSQQGETSSCRSTKEIEEQLQVIWEVAQGQSIDKLDYDSVQDLSLLLDSAEYQDILRSLGRSLGVPPQVIVHLRGFQDLFEYLRSSTYTMLPQLAQAAALLPHPEVVSRIHRAVVTK